MSQTRQSWFSIFKYDMGHTHTHNKQPIPMRWSFTIHTNHLSTQFGISNKCLNMLNDEWKYVEFDLPEQIDYIYGCMLAPCWYYAFTEIGSSVQIFQLNSFSYKSWLSQIKRVQRGEQCRWKRRCSVPEFIALLNIYWIDTFEWTQIPNSYFNSQFYTTFPNSLSLIHFP